MFRHARMIRWPTAALGGLLLVCGCGAEPPKPTPPPAKPTPTPAAAVPSPELTELTARLAALEARLSEQIERQHGTFEEQRQEIERLREEVARLRRELAERPAAPTPGTAAFVRPDFPGDPAADRRLGQQVEDLIRNVDADRPYAGVRALKELADRYPQHPAGVRARRALDEWGVLDQVIDDAHAAEVNQRVGERLRRARERERALAQAQQQLFQSRAPAELAAALLTLSRFLAEEPPDQLTERARMILQRFEVAGPLTEAEAQALAEKLVRQRQAEQEFREAVQVVNHGGEPEQLRQALACLSRIAFGETTLAEGYVQSAREQLRGLGLAAQPTDEQLAAALEQLRTRTEERRRQEEEQRRREQANQEALRLFQEANRLEHQGRAEEAKVLQDELLAKYPETPYARAIQARRAQPEPEPRPPVLMEGNHRMLLNRARELAANGQPDEARQVLEKLKALQPPPEIAAEAERLLRELQGGGPTPTRQPQATDIF